MPDALRHGEVFDGIAATSAGSEDGCPKRRRRPEDLAAVPDFYVRSSRMNTETSWAAPSNS